MRRQRDYLQLLRDSITRGPAVNFKSNNENISSHPLLFFRHYLNLLTDTFLQMIFNLNKLCNWKLSVRLRKMYFLTEVDKELTQTTLLLNGACHFINCPIYHSHRLECVLRVHPYLTYVRKFLVGAGAKFWNEGEKPKQ